MSEKDKNPPEDLSEKDTFDMLLQAIDERNDLQVKAILEKRGLKTGQERLTALLRAVAAKSVTICNQVLSVPRDGTNASGRPAKFSGFDFSNDDKRDRDGTKKALTKAIALDDPIFWKAFYPICRRGDGIRPKSEDIIQTFLEELDSDELLNAHLEAMEAGEFPFFFSIYKDVCKEDPEWVDLVLKYTDKFCSKNKQDHFEDFAANGEELLIKRMLIIWPDLNLEKAFYNALNNKQDRSVRILLPFIDFRRHKESMRSFLDSNIKDQLLRMQALEVFDAAHAGSEDYARVDDQTLSQTKMLGGGKKLVVLFNFHLGEMMQVADSGDGTLSPGPSKSFNEIGRPQGLEELRQKLIDLGGHPDALDIGTVVRKAVSSLKKPNSPTS